jgi:hypothetical protein
VRRSLGAWLLGASLLLATTGEVEAQVSREYDLKAVFLYNLASFIQWPESAFAGPDDPFVIGIVGSDPFGGVLEQIVAGEYVGKRPFAIRRFRRVSEVAGCHLLFISASEARWVPNILARLRGQPVLTVADVPAFAENGGMVGFSTARDQLLLHVNPAAVHDAALAVSSKLLEVAQVVDDSEEMTP